MIFRIAMILGAAPLCAVLALSLPVRAAESLIQSIDLATPLTADSDGTYWMQARPAVLPAKSGSTPKTLITLQKIDRVGTHLYHGIAAMWSDDLGKTWTPAVEIPEAARRPLEGGILETPADMTPQYHRKTGKLLVTGVTFVLDPRLKRDVPGGASHTAYIVYDPQANSWAPMKKLAMPDRHKFHFARAGCTQRVDLPNGDVLLPIYFQAKDSEVAYATVLRCTFDGQTLKYAEHGSELSVAGPTGYRGKGLYEPSLTKFGEKFYLTIRGVDRAYVATSDDGLHFGKPQPWTFDDGKELGSINTQQHWISHSAGLFLAYTRRGADNDNVVRNRAPLFIARVNPERLVVKRATEQVLLPNLGEAFGNFGVCNITPEETWVVDCLRKAQPGAGNVYLARIRWSKPNASP